MSMTVLIYSSTDRRIEKDVDGVVTEIDAKEAKRIFDSGEAADWTLSFYRLAMNDYDKDKTAEQYAEMDRNRSTQQ